MESYVVRIYRRDERCVAGLVETVGAGTRPFKDQRELMDILVGLKGTKTEERSPLRKGRNKKRKV